MRFINRKRRQPPAVIIVALIDVLIVVLIFLMVTTSFKHKQPAIKLTLPVSEQSEPGASEKNPFIITVTKDAPHFHANDLPMTLDALTEELKRRVARNPELHVAVRADTDAPFGKVINLWDAARKAEVKHLEAFTQAARSTQR
jgi:biopolymer transport protein ExbD